jgi:hypothetical protein
VVALNLSPSQQSRGTLALPCPSLFRYPPLKERISYYKIGKDREVQRRYLLFTVKYLPLDSDPHPHRDTPRHDPTAPLFQTLIQSTIPPCRDSV